MFKRGGIYNVNLTSIGDKQHEEVSPALVISNNISNEYSPVVTIIPLIFSNLEKIYDFETFISSSSSSLEKDAKVSSHIIITIDKSNIVGDRIGFLPKASMTNVEKNLRLQLGLEEPPNSQKGI